MPDLIAILTHTVGSPWLWGIGIDICRLQRNWKCLEVDKWMLCF